MIEVSSYITGIKLQKSTFKQVKFNMADNCFKRKGPLIILSTEQLIAFSLSLLLVGLISLLPFCKKL